MSRSGFHNLRVQRTEYRSVQRLLPLIRHGLAGCGILLLNLGAGPSHAQTRTLTLDGCLRMGLEQNLDLQVKRLFVERAREQLLGGDAVYDAQLGLNLDYEDSELPSQFNPSQGGTEIIMANGRVSKTFTPGTTVGVGAGTRSISFLSTAVPIDEINFSQVFVEARQPLLKNALGRRDRAVIAALSAGYSRARLEYLYQRDLLAARTYDAFWNAYAAKRAYEVELQALKRSRELLRINREKFEDGLLDETEILAAEASLATREVRVLELSDLSENARDTLFNTINAPIEIWDRTAFLFDPKDTGVVENEEIDALTAYSVALDQRQDFNALWMARRKVEFDLDARKQEVRPDLALKGSVGVGDTGEEYGDSLSAGQSVWSIGIELTVPWSRTAERSALRQTELQLEQVDAQLDELDQLIIWECRRAARELTTAVKRVTATIRARELQAAKLDREQIKMNQGRSTTRFLIEYQDDLSFAELNEVRARSNFQKALAQYRLVQGTLLNKDPLPSEDHP